MYDPFVLNWFIKALDRWSGRQEVTHLTPAKTEVRGKGGVLAWVSVATKTRKQTGQHWPTHCLTATISHGKEAGIQLKTELFVSNCCSNFCSPLVQKPKALYFNHFKTKSSVWMNYWANSSPSKPRWLQFTSTFTQERRGRRRFTMGWSVCLSLMHIHEE